LKGKSSIKKLTAICLAAALSISLLGGIGTFASAANFTESVYVHKNVEIATGVRINITNYSYQQDSNGKYVKDSSGKYILVQNTKRFIPTDVDGNPVTPFICNGTTYLPIRAISGIFGATIDWNTYYSSVFITTSPTTPKTLTNTNPGNVDTSRITANYTQVPVITGVNIYVNGNLWIPKNVSNQQVDVILMNGTTYLPIRAMSNLFGATIDWDSTNYTAVIYGSVPAEPSGDTGDIEDIDIIQLIKDFIKEKLGKLFDAKGFLEKIKELKEKLGSNFDLSKVIAAFKEKLCGISDAEILSYIKKWADEHGCDLDDIKEKLGAGSTSEIAEAFKEKLKSYFGSCSPEQFKEILKGLISGFDPEAALGNISGGAKLPSAEELEEIKDKLPCMDIHSLIAAIKKKFPSCEIGEGYGGIPDMSSGDFGVFFEKIKAKLTGGF